MPRKPKPTEQIAEAWGVENKHGKTVYVTVARSPTHNWAWWNEHAPENAPHTIAQYRLVRVEKPDADSSC